MLDDSKRIIGKARRRGSATRLPSPFASDVAIVPFPFNAATLDRLVRLEYLHEGDCGDRVKIGEAAAKAIESIEI